MNGTWKLFAGTIGEWILDYKTYDPQYDPSKWKHVYRNNLLSVNENNAQEFCDAMQEFEVTLEDVDISRKGNPLLSISVLVDFDAKTYVNGYSDFLLEKYVPLNWKVIVDDPLKFVPLMEI